MFKMIFWKLFSITFGEFSFFTRSECDIFVRFECDFLGPDFQSLGCLIFVLNIVIHSLFQLRLLETFIEEYYFGCKVTFSR